MKFSVIWWVAAVCLCLVLHSHIARASFGCEKDWAGPSRDNKLSGKSDDNMTCGIWDHYREEKGEKLVIPFFILILLGLTLIIYPIFWIARQICDCCGSNKRRPGHCCCGGDEWDERSEWEKQQQYSTCGRLYLKFCFMGIAGLSVIWMIIIFSGATLFLAGVDNFFDGLLHTCDYGDKMIFLVKNTTTLPDGKLIPGLNASQFEEATDAIQDIREDLQDFRDDIEDNAEVIGRVIMGIAVIPVILLGLGVLLAICNIRTCLPCCCTCIYFLFFIPYAVVGPLAMFLGVVWADICEEGRAHTRREPGFFQWYVVPLCEDEVEYGDIEKRVMEAERDNAAKGCDELLSICSPGAAWDAAVPDKIFQCEIYNSTKNCTGFGAFMNITMDLIPKEGLPASPCVNSPASDCNISVCARDCADPGVKNTTAQGLRYLDYAYRAIKAFKTYIARLLSCNHLIDYVLHGYTMCDSTRDGLRQLGTGCCGHAFLLWVGIILLFKGQKLFFAPMDPPQEPTAAYK